MKHPIPDEALNSHIGILGKTGSGKTYTAKGLVERLLELRRHVVIIDPTGAWYGLRTGFDIPIFGGRQDDIEISDKAGEAVATVIVEQRTSAVVDLSLLSGGAQRRFMRAKERARIASFIEARAGRVARHGGRRTATHLRAVAGDLKAGLHEGHDDGR